MPRCGTSSRARPPERLENTEARPSSRRRALEPVRQRSDRPLLRSAAREEIGERQSGRQGRGDLGDAGPPRPATATRAIAPPDDRELGAAQLTLSVDCCLHAAHDPQEAGDEDGRGDPAEKDDDPLERLQPPARRPPISLAEVDDGHERVGRVDDRLGEADAPASTGTSASAGACQTASANAKITPTAQTAASQGR